MFSVDLVSFSWCEEFESAPGLAHRFFLAPGPGEGEGDDIASVEGAMVGLTEPRLKLWLNSRWDWESDYCVRVNLSKY